LTCCNGTLALEAVLMVGTILGPRMLAGPICNRFRGNGS